MKTTKLLAGAKETADMLGVSKPIMYKLCNREDFPCFRIGKKLVISIDGLKTWISNHYGEDILVEVTNEEDTTK